MIWSDFGSIRRCYRGGHQWSTLQRGTNKADDYHVARTVRTETGLKENYVFLKLASTNEKQCLTI